MKGLIFVELHVRTIKEAVAYIKALDPGTSITETGVRTLVRAGMIPYTRLGKKYLISIEALEEYLRGQPPVDTEKKPPKQQHIWKIS